jgi:hypothetical protein
MLGTTDSASSRKFVEGNSRAVGRSRGRTEAEGHDRTRIKFTRDAVEVSLGVDRELRALWEYRRSGPLVRRRVHRHITLKTRRLAALGLPQLPPVLAGPHLLSSSARSRSLGPASKLPTLRESRWSKIRDADQ